MSVIAVDYKQKGETLVPDELQYVEVIAVTDKKGKSAVEAEVQAEIDKLNKALAMDLIGQDEYDAKVGKLNKRVENFEAIKKIQQKCEMGIITAAERDKEIDALLM